MKYEEKERRPHFWRDITNNVWIPEKYPNQKGDGSIPPYFHWAITVDQYREFLSAKGIHKTIKELREDPLHIWATVNYISTYSTEKRPIKVEYYGPHDAWRQDLKRLLVCYEDLYGCIPLGDKIDEGTMGIDPYPDQSVIGSYERLRNMEQVRVDCKRSGGIFVELSEFMEKAMTMIIEEALKEDVTDRTNRERKVLSLYKEGQSQSKVAESMHMSLRDVSKILKENHLATNGNDGNDDGNIPDNEYDEET